jgi:hypothetical protein
MTTFLDKNKKDQHVKLGSLRQLFHWYIMLAVVVTGLLIVLVKAVLIFIQINYDQGVVETTSESVIIFDSEKLESSVEYFNIQNKTHTDLLATPPVVTDPS